MPKSTGKRSKTKPDKPYPDFPLFPHATGRWAKKIRGKFHYFGPWDDPNAALEKYLDQRDDLHAGRTPRESVGGLTIRELLNRFLTAKKNLVDTGEIKQQTFGDYHATCKRIGDEFGLDRPVEDLRTEDFERLKTRLSKTRGLVALGNEIQRVRVAFKYAYDAELVDKPIRYGPNFKRPSKRILRQHRNAKGPRMFEADEVQAMLDAAGMPLKAMILLGINCGFGNADCAYLPKIALDLKNGWVDYPHPKTGIARRCPLWPETVESLREVLARRPKATEKAAGSLVFITKYGRGWGKETSDNPIAKEMAKLLQRVTVKRGRKKQLIYRRGLGFYALRHTFETIGGDAKDQVAVDHIMGHARDDMASVYRERIDDKRLKAVTNHVHDWLFPPDADPDGTEETRASSSIGTL